MRMLSQEKCILVINQFRSLNAQIHSLHYLEKMVRDRLGPVAFFKQALIIKRLPKTRSGKILRSTVCKIADGEQFKVPATIDDPLILEEIKEALATIGYPRS